MKEQYKNEKLIGYNIGKNIRIHSHIDDPKSWFLSIKGINIFGERLCDKSASKTDMSDHIYRKLNKHRYTYTQLIEEVLPLL